jgi:hypothetical protein
VVAGPPTSPAQYPAERHGALGACRSFERPAHLPAVQLSRPDPLSVKRFFWVTFWFEFMPPITSTPP